MNENVSNINIDDGLSDDHFLCDVVLRVSWALAVMDKETLARL